MKARVTEGGVTVPRHMLEGMEEVEIHEENGRVVIEPVRSTADEDDPILGLGSNPVSGGGLPDASERHDDYLYGNVE